MNGQSSNLPPPVYSFAPRDVEINFTFYYFLGFSLYAESDLAPVENVGFKPRPWTETATAHNISDRFLEKLVLAHFHLDPQEYCKSRVLSVKTYAPHNPSERIEQRFSLDDDFSAELASTSEETIGAIECTIFKNGYMAVTLRFRNEGELDSNLLVHLIRHVEKVKAYNAPSNRPLGSLTDSDPGELVISVDRFVDRELQDGLQTILKQWGLKHHRLVEKFSDLKERGDLHRFPYVSERLPLRQNRTRPYVGTLFRNPKIIQQDQDAPQRNVDTLKETRQLVVAAGRATPAFLSQFDDVESYLTKGERNVYGAGNSIVYIGKRAWCVYDARRHNRQLFRIGVVETTHFVIMAIETAARARRRFSKDVNAIGDRIFEELIQDIYGMICPRVIGPVIKLGTFMKYRNSDKLAISFLASVKSASPLGDDSQLLEAHLVSHTARAAVRRCTDLTLLKQLDRSCAQFSEGYAAQYRISTDYIRHLTLPIRIASIILAIIGIGVAIILKN